MCVCATRAASVAKRGICNISKVFNAHIWFLQAESLSNLSWGLDSEILSSSSGSS